MAQVTETVARGILAGQGYTDNEVRQLAHHWLASHGQACPNIDDLCTKIKAADDAAADRDYMLDSNDCIAVLRGEWKAPLAMDKPERASHGQTPDTKTPILQWIMKTAERAKEPCGDDPESPAAVRNSALASIAGAAAQALGLVSGPHYWQAPVTDAERTALILALRALQHCSPNLTSDRAWQPDGLREQRAEAISACAEVLASQAAAPTTQPAPQSSPASQGDALDAARLDWLDRNIFFREMSERDAKYGHGSAYNMWVLFAPKGAHSSARNIIDAARAAQPAEAPQPSPAAQEDALDAALDAFENKERGIPQAHIAAALVAELRATIDAARAAQEGKAA